MEGSRSLDGPIALSPKTGGSESGGAFSSVEGYDERMEA
jgi:hypothetical protein